MEEDIDTYRVDEGLCKACLDLQGGREQRIYRSPNGHGASLISAPKLGGVPSWTIVALRFEGEEFDAEDIPGITNGRVGDWQSSVKALMIIKDRPHF